MYNSTKVSLYLTFTVNIHTKMSSFVPVHNLINSVLACSEVVRGEGGGGSIVRSIDTDTILFL